MEALSFPWLRHAADVLIVLAAVAGMEVFAIVVHRHVMHGWGWGWHRSHHEERRGATERNDLYAVVFAAIAIALIAIGTDPAWRLARLLGIGMTVYGLLYLLVHDGLVHRRLPLLRWTPRSGYLKRLVQAHRLHHAVQDREGCVSYGFLWAPPAARLKQDLRGRAKAARR